MSIVSFVALVAIAPPIQLYTLINSMIVPITYARNFGASHPSNSSQGFNCHQAMVKLVENIY
ncbi:MAG: hypothetical protein V7K47_10740 [Nostoc sp.]